MREGKLQNKPTAERIKMYRIEYKRGNRNEKSPEYHSLWTATYVAKNYVLEGWYWESAKVIDTITGEVKATFKKEDWNSATVSSATL